jgi:hypothetical protein
LAVLGLELKAYTLIEPLHQPFFMMGFFGLGAQELFAWAGFKPQSS